jgi:hypothetical protein
MFSKMFEKMIKSMKTKWAGHAARIGGKRSVYNVLVGKAEGKNH